MENSCGENISPISLLLTVVIQLVTDFISSDQSLVNFETFCCCNFRSIVFFKRNRSLITLKFEPPTGMPSTYDQSCSTRVIYF